MKTFNNSKSEIINISNYVVEQLERFHCDQKSMIRFETCLDEILSNILNYSNASEVSIDMNDINNVVEVRFIDNGTKFNPLEEIKEPDITLSLEERQIGGLGVFMVKKMMDEVSYQYINNKNILTIKKKIGD